MTSTTTYAVSMRQQDGFYTVLAHMWDRNTMMSLAQRELSSRVRMTAISSASSLARRLDVPFCETPGDLKKALARHVVRSSSVSASRFKSELLAGRSMDDLTDHYGLPAETVLEIRYLLTSASLNRVR